MEKAIQIVFRGDVIPPYMTSFTYTPKKSTRPHDNSTPEEGEIIQPRIQHFKDRYYPKDSVSTKASYEDLFDRGGYDNRRNTLNPPPPATTHNHSPTNTGVEETKYTVKRKLNKNDDITAMFTDDSNDFDEALDKKIKKNNDSHKKIPVQREERDPKVVKKERERSESVLSSILGGDKKENSGKKTSSASKSGLASLFAKKDDKPEKKVDDDDDSNNIMKRLLGAI
jgi:hypothetical protein